MSPRKTSPHALWPLALISLVILNLPAVLSAQQAPFEGQVVEDQVPIRAGGAPQFYVVGQLQKGQKVQVEEIVFGWYKIIPPPDVASVIAKDHVQVQPDGKTALVSVEVAPVFAANIESTQDPNRHWRRQLNLARGQKVEIIGEDGTFWKIKPPAGAFVYVAPGAIRRVETPVPTATTPQPTPQPSAALPPSQPTTGPAPSITPSPTTSTPPPTPPAPSTAETAPAAQPTPTPSPSAAPTVTPPPSPTPPTPVQPPQPAVRQAAKLFAEAEAAFKEAQSLPVEEQPLDHLLGLYRALQTRSDLLPSELRIVVARIAQLQRNAQIAAELRQIQGLRQEIQERERMLQEQALRQAQENLALPDRAKHYDAIGMLQASAIYDGTRLPRLFRLVDPATQRTIAYVNPSPMLDPRIYLGQVVGLIGQRRYDQALQLALFEVREIDILQPASRP